MNEVDAIFGAFSKLSEISYLNHERREKIKQINDITAKRCGNCHLWMKSGCIPEKVKKQFKTCNDFGCGLFIKKFYVEELKNKFENELSDIESKLSKITKSA